MNELVNTNEPELTVDETVKEPDQEIEAEDISVQEQADQEEDKAPDDPDDDAGDADENEADQGPELVDWEGDDGVVYQLPADIVPSLMKNKDYTQKTQAVAAQKQEIEKAKAEWEALKQRDEEDLKIDTEIYRLSELDKQYGALDWDRLADEDMDLARRRQFEHDRVRTELTNAKAMKDQRTAERSQAYQAQARQRIEEAEQYAAANIPNWGAEKAREIWEYAQKDLGYDEATLQSSLDERLMRLIHKAYVGDAAMRKAKGPAPKPKQATEPLKKVDAKSGPTTRRNLADADYDTYHEMIKGGADPVLSSLR